MKKRRLDVSMCIGRIMFELGAALWDMLPAHSGHLGISCRHYEI